MAAPVPARLRGAGGGGDDGDDVSKNEAIRAVTDHLARQRMVGLYGKTWRVTTHTTHIRHLSSTWTAHIRRSIEWHWAKAGLRRPGVFHKESRVDEQYTLNGYPEGCSRVTIRVPTASDDVAADIGRDLFRTLEDSEGGRVL